MSSLVNTVYEHIPNQRLVDQLLISVALASLLTRVFISALRFCIIFNLAMQNRSCLHYHSLRVSCIVCHLNIIINMYSISDLSLDYVTLLN